MRHKSLCRITNGPNGYIVCSNSSKVAIQALSTEGEHRRRCCTRDALKEALRRHRASCELIKLSLFTALERSAQRSAHALSRFGPRNNGAPSKIASWVAMRSKDYFYFFITLLSHMIVIFIQDLPRRSNFECRRYHTNTIICRITIV